MRRRGVQRAPQPNRFIRPRSDDSGHEQKSGRDGSASQHRPGGFPGRVCATGLPEQPTARRGRHAFSPHAFSPRALWNRAGLRQMVESLPVGAEAHGLRAQLDDKVVHFGFGYQRLYIVPSRPAGSFGIAEDLAAPPRQ
ncbi:MAG: hypothetical protein QOF90_3633 [Acetobacteraceae bacterium]|nr:hypothetical protein [Acetobacteraceae bacterium]